MTERRDMRENRTAVLPKKEKKKNKTNKRRQLIHSGKSIREEVWIKASEALWPICKKKTQLFTYFQNTFFIFSGKNVIDQSVEKCFPPTGSLT